MGPPEAKARDPARNPEPKNEPRPTRRYIGRTIRNARVHLPNRGQKYSIEGQ